MVVGLLLSLMTAPALAAPADSAQALTRLSEVMDRRLQDGRLSRQDLLPAIVVSTEPAYDETADWYPTQALSTLVDVVGEDQLRVCEACMVPRTVTAEGSLTWQSGPVALADVVELDEQHRGNAVPAKTAVWLDETPAGVSVRIVDLATSGVVFAQNVDPSLTEEARTEQRYTESDELDRRSRQLGLTHTFVDLAAYPQMHVAFDFTDQWGTNNRNLTGFTISVVTPLIGVGIVHYHTLRAGNVMVGAKLIASAPNAIVRRFELDSEDFGLEKMDPLFTGVGVVRIPFGRSNYAFLMTANTTGSIGLGLTLLNPRILPGRR